MSLLEDIFLGDEAGEAQELERVIDGDEFDERPRPMSPNSDENSEREDEAEEDKRRVDPTQSKSKRAVKNPRFILNPARLTGPRGIQVIPDHYKDFRFKGKGHEKEDLDLVLKKLEHWAYRLYPKFKFNDCLKKIETLGKKRPVMVHLHKIRTDQFAEEPIVQRDSSDDETPAKAQVEDEFDKLLQQQIELARATPAPGSSRKGALSPKDRSFIMPKATSSPSISDEQRNRMLMNRRLAEERRLAKLSQNNTNINNNTDSDIVITPSNPNTEPPHAMSSALDKTEAGNHFIGARKVNRSQIIDSSDEDCEVTAVNHSISIEVHKDTDINHRHETLDYGKDSTAEQNYGDIETVDDSEIVIEKNTNDTPTESEMVTSSSTIDNNPNIEELKDCEKIEKRPVTNLKDSVVDSDVIGRNFTDSENNAHNENYSNKKESKDTVTAGVMDVDFNDDL